MRTSPLREQLASKGASFGVRHEQEVVERFADEATEYRRVRDAVTVPLTILGGAGSLEDIGKLVNAFGIIGACAGSLFVFKGPYRAVLINYPSPEEKDALIEAHWPR